MVVMIKSDGGKIGVSENVKDFDYDPKDNLVRLYRDDLSREVYEAKANEISIETNSVYIATNIHELEYPVYEFLSEKGKQEKTEEKERDGKGAVCEDISHPDPTDIVLTMIYKERRRQIQEKGYLPDRDDRYTQGELAEAAAAYCVTNNGALDGALYPWDEERFNKDKHGRKDQLIIAGAFILAELERLERKGVDDGGD